VWTSKIFWKLFLVYAGLCLTLVIGSLWVVSAWQHDDVVRRTSQSLSDDQKADLIERAAATQRRLWLFAAAATMFALGISYALVARIVRPLAKLTEGAQAIVEEDDWSPLPDGSDELGALGLALREMQRKLASRVDQL
jgi:HAMP domain-containing protein